MDCSGLYGNAFRLLTDALFVTDWTVGAFGVSNTRPCFWLRAADSFRCLCTPKLPSDWLEVRPDCLLIGRSSFVFVG